MRHCSRRCLACWPSGGHLGARRSTVAGLLSGTKRACRLSPALQMQERKYKNMLRTHRSQRIENARKVGGSGVRYCAAASSLCQCVQDR